MNVPPLSPVTSHGPRQFTILLFAGLRDALKCGQITVSIPQGKNAFTVADLLRECATEFPLLADWLPHVRVAVNLEYADLDTPVHDGDEIAFIPPVAGG